MNNVIDYLEASAGRFPDKVAVKDINKSYTFSELQSRAFCMGTYLAGYVGIGKPVAVFSEKSVDVLAAFMGTVCAGGFYVLVEPSFPVSRINSIFDVLKPEVIICPDGNLEKLRQCSYECAVISMEELVGQNVADMELLSSIKEKHIDTDPLYGIFTSGSTGVPKCVVVCHRSVIDFIDVFTETFGITDRDVIGNQAPFDFDVSVKDIYSGLKTGATIVLIPKSYFMFPNNVTDLLDDNGVTTLIWAVSALCLLVRLHGLKYKRPSAINKIMFSGETMPVKQLNQWKQYYPDAMYVNLYGPTEITCNCMYHVLDREYKDTDKLPIGRAFRNERVVLLSEDNELICEPGTVGEICVMGTALACGYYNNPEATARSFVTSPLNRSYAEQMYRTGDLGYYGDEGLMYFAGRRDFQIKHMGHRIELEEIDSMLNAADGIDRACTFFDQDRNKMVTYYTGEGDSGQIKAELRVKVPEYMIPNIFVRVAQMPLNKNGKIDRTYLRNVYQNGGSDGDK